MSFSEALNRFFAGWNDHDPAAVVGSFIENGTYEDPTTAGPLSGDALAASVARLVSSIPDVSFELVSVAATGETTAAVQWIMHGTNAASVLGRPATKATIALPGADFIGFDPALDRLTNVVGYFDTGTMQQIGLQAHASPADAAGRVDFGLASRIAHGEPVEPGCFTVTSIEVSGQSALEADEIANMIVGDIMAQPGYLGSVFATVGGRKYTFTAWRDVNAVEGIRTGAHREAMRRFNSGSLGTRVMASVWVPHRLNPVRASTTEGERPVRVEPHAEQWL